eukprot:superscaffoldBa00003735_g17583
MTESDQLLLNILDDLENEEFKRFKWHLRREKVGDIPSIKKRKLKAKRRDVVDLIVQTYEFAGAVEVIKSILKKISRNDLVGELPNIGSGAEDGDLQKDSTPEVLTESSNISYRFRCPGPGVFPCTLTGLVFVMAQEAELLYKTVQWDESLLQQIGKMAAGPLFNIQSPDGAVSQLHLPHCETMN